MKAQAQKKTVRFPVEKNHVMETKVSGVSIIHCYPMLGAYLGDSIPDTCNPRSHSEDILKSRVSKEIRNTINDAPELFIYANRGATILVESAKYDEKKGEMVLTFDEDSDAFGVADGATTIRTLQAAQEEAAQGLERGSFPEVKADELPEKFKKGRIHLEIIHGLEDKGDIMSLVSGRNTSREVRIWSLQDFGGSFQFLKDILEANGSPFAGKIAYEEHAQNEVTILEVLSLMNLFRAEYTRNGNQPTFSYSGSGRMSLLLEKEESQKEFKALSPILPEILRLHDYIYANFEKAYMQSYGPKAKLGRRVGIVSRRTSDPLILPLTGSKSNYVIPKGLIYPLLAAFRALVGYNNKGAYFLTDPFQFFDKHGATLVRRLMDQADAAGNNPNKLGKTSTGYNALYDGARLLFIDTENKQEQTASPQPVLATAS
jgi:hypothetical protein